MDPTKRVDDIRRFTNQAIATEHSKLCGCPHAFMASVGTSGMTAANVSTLACLCCLKNIAVYRSQWDEPNRGEVQLVGVERLPIAKDVLGWLDGFPRRVGTRDFVSSKKRFATVEELESIAKTASTDTMMDRFVAAGLPDPLPTVVIPTSVAGFETVRACLTNNGATFRDWVCWTRFHPAIEFALDRVQGWPNVVSRLLKLLRTEPDLKAARSALYKLGKRDPATVSWLRAQLQELEGDHSDQFAAGLDRLADEAKMLEAFELAPKLIELAQRLDASTPRYVKDRINRIGQRLTLQADSQEST